MYTIVSILLVISLSIVPVAYASELPFYLKDQSPLPQRTIEPQTNLYVPGKNAYADWLLKRAALVSKKLEEANAELERYPENGDQKQLVERNWVLLKIGKKTQYLKFLNEKFETVTKASMKEAGYAFNGMPSSSAVVDNKVERSEEKESLPLGSEKKQAEPMVVADVKKKEDQEQPVAQKNEEPKSENLSVDQDKLQMVADEVEKDGLVIPMNIFKSTEAGDAPTPIKQDEKPKADQALDQDVVDEKKTPNSESVSKIENVVVKSPMVLPETAPKMEEVKTPAVVCAPVSPASESLSEKEKETIKVLDQVELPPAPVEEKTEVYSAIDPSEQLSEPTSSKVADVKSEDKKPEVVIEVKKEVVVEAPKKEEQIPLTAPITIISTEKKEEKKTLVSDEAATVSNAPSLSKVEEDNHDQTVKVVDQRIILTPVVQQPQPEVKPSPVATPSPMPVVKSEPEVKPSPVAMPSPMSVVKSEPEAKPSSVVKTESESKKIYEEILSAEKSKMEQVQPKVKQEPVAPVKAVVAPTAPKTESSSHSRTRLMEDDDIQEASGPAFK